jgi:phosphoribosylaminoimidazole (AIR) synthetase
MEVKEALKTFNCGIGAVVIVDPSLADEVLAHFHSAEGNEPLARVIGSVGSRTGDEEQVSVVNVESMFALSN